MINDFELLQAVHVGFDFNFTLSEGRRALLGRALPPVRRDYRPINIFQHSSVAVRFCRVVDLAKQHVEKPSWLANELYLALQLAVTDFQTTVSRVIATANCSVALRHLIVLLHSAITYLFCLD